MKGDACEKKPRVHVIYAFERHFSLTVDKLTL